ncbi:MAG: diflavin flavoprotein A [Leptolyngbya sp. SIO1D8]|nr:diflavin flavoprotein A [Leptolyngbya sp. SIO1D8]
MVLLADSLQTARSSSRLTLQSRAIARHSTAIRCLDWDRERFDIEFELQNGTTYNSFLIQGDQTALIDTSHRKFESLYFNSLKGLVNLTEIDYLIVNHTEPDHSGLIEALLKQAPHLTVVGSKVAIQFLENQVHDSFKAHRVKHGDQLDLGQGHQLTFISAPNLHWPDTIFTYDQGTQVLYTCDVFGMHYCDDAVYDEAPQLLEPDFQYYYDCLMKPNARSVLGALKRMAPFPVGLIATGHGPLLQHHKEEWIGRYRTWSEAQSKAAPFVALFYTDHYGYSDLIAHAIAAGIRKTAIDVELVDTREAEAHDVRELVSEAAGLVIGMPPQADPSNSLYSMLSTILATAHPKQAIGLFETGSGHDEPIYPLRNRFQELGLTEAFAPIVITSAPSDVMDKLCEEAGTDLGQWLNRDRTKQQVQSLEADLDQALGRLSSGLYLLTVRKGDVTGAMLASWVMQASFQPLSVAIAIAKDRAIESLLQMGDTFVLNTLEEGNYQPLMKHFLKRFPPGADRFTGVATYDAPNGSPILAEALAYLECTVTHRLELSDHWIVHCTATAGRVANLDGLTAVHHRQVGSHY